MRSLYTYFLLLSLPYFTMAQVPFECNGDFLLALTNGIQPSIFYRIVMDPENNGNVIFDQLPAANAGTVINAMGYRTTDNFVYGVHPEDYDLFRIDATGEATFITNLDLNDEDVYFTGAISPDGKHLLLIGNHKGWAGLNHAFARVNLEDFTVTNTIISNLGDLNRVTDMAFDPTTGILYSFEGETQKLVIIDPWNGFVDKTTYPSNTVASTIGALFFDAFGNLYGYGTKIGGNTSDTFFRIDTETGEVTIEASGPDAAGKDGCACSNTIDLMKKVEPEVTFPCSEVTYVFEIANASSSLQSGIDFLDEMPPQLTITEIISNPFGGQITSGVGTNVLSISNMTIPAGIDSIIVKAEVAEFSNGFYNNQATISNLPEHLGGVTVSDNPKTFTLEDSTILEVRSVVEVFQKDTVGMCDNDVIALEAFDYNGVHYEWDDGSTEFTRLVSEPGVYWIAISTTCETHYDTIVVVENSLEIELGPDLQINLADSVHLEPDVTSHGSITYQWTDPLDNSISCLTCGNTYARPAFDITYNLTAIDEFGCIDKDEINITLQKERDIYAPNSFSPNGDGINDRFFLQSSSTALIQTFRIYDRWGGLIFEHQGGYINDSAYGWDGKYNQTDMNTGVYLWYAELEFFDGETLLVSGDVTIFR